MYTGSICSSTSAQDVVFVIDRSGSYYDRFDRYTFSLIRNLVASITQELIQISPRSAVGLIQFSGSAFVDFNLEDYYMNLNGLLLEINQLYYIGGSRDTAEALTFLLSTAQNGKLGLRNDTSKVAIVITTGQSISPSATLSAAAALHASNIFDVYAVGINLSNLTEIYTIASSPEFVFFTNSSDDTHLKQLQKNIQIQMCNGK